VASSSTTSRARTGPPLPARIGYSRDGKRGTLQIEYGLLTDPLGRPIAVEVVPGNTGDPATVPAAVEKLRVRFGLAEVVLVGDRGMLTSTQIETSAHRGSITALRGPAIARSRGGRPARRSTSAIAESSLDPGAAARRLPQSSAAERAKRGLLAATGPRPIAAVRRGTPAGAAIGPRQRVIDRHKMAKHFASTSPTIA
jgi:hypothetical protein